jgi:Tetracyclin repressor-like, C-terminal domain
MAERYGSIRLLWPPFRRCCPAAYGLRKQIKRMKNIRRAVDHQTKYLLLYGYEGACPVQQRNSQVDHAFSRVVNVLYAIVREAAAAGEIDTERIAAATSAALRRQFAAWREQNDQPGNLPDGALAAVMIAYAQLHGAITLELLGHVPSPLDHVSLFDPEMAHAYSVVGRSPRT